MNNYSEIVKRLEKSGSVCVRTWISGNRKGEKEILPLDTVLEPEEGCFDEKISDAPKLYIFGSGYVAEAVCHLASYTGFQTVVFDDREDLLTKERFPDAQKLVCDDFIHLLKELKPYGNAYYAVMTRGHKLDFECVRRIMDLPFRYAAMIGSKKKQAYVREALRKSGAAPERVAELCSPAGLDIGGRTPQEIGISVCAQMIQYRSREYHTELPIELRKHILAGTPGVMATIINKTGSAPRDPGCRMLICDDGTLCGTIGGGKVEYLVIKDAASAEHMSIREYDMENGDMICGGKIKVLFERMI